MPRSEPLQFERVSPDPRVQSDYEEMRRGGMAHKLAEMLALQEPPSLKTDTRWMRGQVNFNQFANDPWTGTQYRRVAEQAGVNIEGAVYKHQLARFPGDPKAWVRSRSDVLKIARERNLNLEGSVTHKAVDDGTPNPLDQPYRVADDIVDAKVAEYCERNPGTDPTDVGLRDRLTRLHSGES